MSAPTKFGMRSNAGPTLTPVSMRRPQTRLRTAAFMLLRPAQREWPLSGMIASLPSAMGARNDAVPFEGARDAQSARSSRHGAAMICTPIGSLSPSVHNGAATTGRPMNEMGWVKSPILGRTSISLPSRTKVFWPSFGARHGVAGARRMSALAKERQRLLAKPAAELLRLHVPGARQHRARDRAGRERRDRNPPRGSAGVEDGAPRLRPW